MKTITTSFLLMMSVALASAGALEGIVNDTKGQPLKNADVKIEARTGKFSKTVKTDAKGHYFSDGMLVGTNYKVSLIVNGSVKAAILNATAREGKPATLNFDLRTTKNPGKTHLVYVAPELGTHIGGGRWVEVDDNGNPVSDNANIQNISGESIRHGSAGLPNSSSNSAAGH